MTAGSHAGVGPPAPVRQRGIGRVCAGEFRLDASVMHGARQAWSKLCWDGISDSSTQYWQLNQAEAAGHVRVLEQALSTLHEIDQSRAAAWRETTMTCREV